MSKRVRESVDNEGPQIVRPRREESAFEIIKRWCQVAESCKEKHPVVSAVRFGTAEDVIAIVEHGKECARQFREKIARQDEEILREDSNEYVYEFYYHYVDDDASTREPLCGYEVKLLEDIDVDGLALLTAAVNANNLETVEYFFSKGANVNLSTLRRDPISSLFDVCITPPLHCAVKVENAAMVRVLLAAGADVNLRNAVFEEHTALHYAAKRGNRAIFHMLLDVGADVNARDKNGNTALCYLTRENRLDMVRTLVSRGANINANNYYPGSALIGAVVCCDTPSPDVLKELIRLGASLEDRSQFGETALISAAQRGKLDLVRVLLDAGANVAAVDNHLQTPLSHAASFGHHEVVDLIVNSPGGAETLEMENEDGRTAISYAALFVGQFKKDNPMAEEAILLGRRNYGKTMDILLSKGAILKAEDREVLKVIDLKVYQRYFSE